MDYETTVVVVSGSHSYCFGCGGNVVPDGANLHRHVDTAGYQAVEGGGCGAIFARRTSDQGGVTQADKAYDWAGLPWIDYADLLKAAEAATKPKKRRRT